MSAKLLTSAVARLMLQSRSMWRVTHLAVVITVALLGGCATQSASVVEQPLAPATPRTVRVERCEDRSGFSGERDICTEATRALTEKLQGSRVFRVSPDAALVITCDIERFVEGSAVKRWLWPGWGATQAMAAVTVWQRPGDQALATFRSQAHVEVGGLYTIGAGRYIFSAAFADIVGELDRWAAGAK